MVEGGRGETRTRATLDHSSMAVAFKGLVSTQFDVPANQEKGPSKLEVVANGIPSAPMSIHVQ